MSCHDARQSYAALLAGGLGLTEWALIEAHVARCDGCRQALDQAFHAVPAEAPRRRSLPGGHAPTLYRAGAGIAIVVLLIGLGAYAYRVTSHAEHAVARRASSETTPSTPPAPPPVLEGARSGAAAPPPVPPVTSDRVTGALTPTPPVGMDVVVQLAAPDRKGAERDLSSLVVRVGGARAPRGRDATVRATVPRSRYREFTRGLGRIGPWEVERKSATLPDPVRVAVKLTRK